MKKHLLTLLAAMAATMAIAQKSDFSPVDYVNPLIGTQSTFDFSTGNTYPPLHVRGV